VARLWDGRAGRAVQRSALCDAGEAGGAGADRVGSASYRPLSHRPRPARAFQGDAGAGTWEAAGINRPGARSVHILNDYWYRRVKRNPPAIHARLSPAADTRRVMTLSLAARARTLVAIPAYNEAATIRHVVERVRQNLPDCDLVVVDDGSTDATASALVGTGATVVTHLCNLGYGRAIQTAVLYADREGYDRLVTLDADGQHDPAQVRPLLAEFDGGHWDLLIASRYVLGRTYAGVPFGRRIGMLTFSSLVGMMTGHRVYDTTSGLKVIGRQTFTALTNWQFIDFHAEALVYLMRLGFRIAESPITVEERRHGTTMYSALSHFKYPLKTALMVVLGVIEANLTRRRTS